MNNDINKYYLSLIQEIATRQLSNEDGDNQEQTFTRYVLDVLSEAGETENATVAFDEKDLESLRYHAKATDEEIEYDIDEEIDEVVSYTVLEDDENA